MSWSFDTGSIQQAFTVQGGQQVPDAFGINLITLSDSGTFYHSLGNPTGTAAIEKIESLRVRINYRIDGFQDSRNIVVFRPGGMAVTAPGQLSATAVASNVPPELVLLGEEAHVGNDLIDVTFTPDGAFADPVQSLIGDLIFNPAGWLTPQLRIDMLSFGTLTVTLTRVRITVTSTYVGIDPDDNDGSARPTALDGDLAQTGAAVTLTGTGGGGGQTSGISRGPNYTWITPPPNNAIFDTNYTVRIEHITLETQGQSVPGSYSTTSITGSNRNPYASTLTANPLDDPGVLTVRLGSGVTGAPLEGTTGVFSFGGSQVNTFEVSLTHGAVVFTFQFKADGYAIDDNVYIEVLRPDGTPIQRLRHWVSMTPASMVFQSQPVAETEIGLPLGTVEVAFVDSNGDVLTGVTDNITLAAVQEDGASPVINGTLQGTLTVAAVSGVATFTDLSFDGVGIIKLKATSGSNIPALSNPINVLGFPIPDIVTGLRQNLAEDGTTWVSTTGVSSPSYGTPTDDEQLIIDGDNAVEDSVTQDGFRWRFKFPFILKSIFMRGILSTLTGAPTIEVYTSTDTTNGQNGTWTLLTTFTPARVQLFQRVSFPDLTPTSPAVRGIWVTLNDQGGAATMDWQAIHIAGMYLGSPVLFGDRALGLPIQDDELVSIPRTGDKLFGAASASREMYYQNTLAKQITVEMEQKAARYGGDSLADPVDFTFTNPAGGAAFAGGIIQPTAQLPYDHNYDITVGDNDGSGQHLSRVTLRRVDATISVTLDVTTTPDSFLVRNAYTGELLVTIQPTGGSAVKGWAIDLQENELIVNRGTVKPFDFDVYSLETGFLLRTFQVTDASIGATINSNRLAMTANRKLVLSTDDTSGGDDAVVFDPDGTFDKLLSLTTARPGDRAIVAGSGDYVAINEGAGTSNAPWDIYETTSNTVLYQCNPVSDTAGVVAGGWYDPVNSEWCFQTVSGSFYYIARYDLATGTLQSATSALTKPDGTYRPFGWVDSVTNLEYIFWQAEEMYSGTIGDYANFTQLYDLDRTPVPSQSATDFGQPGFGAALVEIPGYFASIILTPDDVVGNLDDGLSVEDLNFALVLNEGEAPVAERYTTWGLAADAGVLYQNLAQPNLLVIGNAGIIYALDNTRTSDEGGAIPMHFRTGPVPQSTPNTDVHTFRRFHEIGWETASTPPAQGWFIQLHAWDVDNPDNSYVTSFTQLQREVRVRLPLRARQIMVEFLVSTTQDYNPVGMRLRFQNTPRPLRGYNG